MATACLDQFLLELTGIKVSIWV